MYVHFSVPPCTNLFILCSCDDECDDVTMYVSCMS